MSNLTITLASPGAYWFPHFDSMYTFISLLQQPQSTLGPHVRNICVLGPDEVAGLPSFHTLDDDYEKLNTALENVLPHLLGLRSLRFEMVIWSRLSGAAKTAIQACSSVTSVTWHTIYIQRLEELLSFTCGGFPALTHLDINNLHLTEETDSIREGSTTRPPLPQISFPNLCALSLRAAREVALLLSITSPCMPYQPHNITTPVLSADKAVYFRCFGGLIRASGPSIRHLELSFSPHLAERPYYSAISLEKSINLTTLCFGQFDSMACVDAWWYDDILKTVPSGLPRLDLWVYINRHYTDSAQFNLDKLQQGL
ncbi:hypothetical protein DXG01_007708 [Tephrocybe rancida]|nr:hypothetical protein DXG01_007708 [Tephrocybe rancida]